MFSTAAEQAIRALGEHRGSGSARRARASRDGRAAACTMAAIVRSALDDWHKPRPLKLMMSLEAVTLRQPYFWICSALSTIFFRSSDA